jgi:ABC-type sugar transport system ATPase subunit
VPLSKLKKQFEVYLDSYEIQIDSDCDISNLSHLQMHMLMAVMWIAAGKTVICFNEIGYDYSNAEKEILSHFIKRLKSDKISVIYTTTAWEDFLTHMDRISVFRDGICVKVFWDAKKSASLVNRYIYNYYEQPMKGHDFFNESRQDNNAHEDSIYVDCKPEVSMKKGNVSMQEGNINMQESNVNMQEADMHVTRTHIKSTLAKNAIQNITAYYDSENKSDVIAEQIQTSAQLRHLRCAVIVSESFDQDFFLDESLKDNLLMSIANRVSHTFGIADRKMQKVLIDDSCNRMGIPVEIVDVPLGNLPRRIRILLLFYRWQLRKIDLLLLVNPTASCDLHEQMLILEEIRKCARAGMNVTVISNDIQELNALTAQVIDCANEGIFEEMRY